MKESLLAVQYSVLISRRADNDYGYTHQYNEFNETFTTHEDSNREALAPYQLAGLCSESATNNLTRECKYNNSNYISPCYSIIEQPKISAQSRQGEIEREKEGRYKIFDLFGNLNSKAALVRAYQSDHESCVKLVISSEPVSIYIPPNIGCTPIIPVNQAEVRTIRSVNVTMV